jgi:hypothetical protein
MNNVKYLPLALPRVECDSTQIKNYIDNRGSRVNYSWTECVDQPWNHVIVRAPVIKSKDGEIPGSGWRPDFKKTFPAVIDAVERLPFTSIKYVYLFEQIIDVKPHHDNVGKNPYEHLEPASYRITLLMEDQETFYICDDFQCTTFTHPRYPTDTNTWAFSNNSVPHGSVLPRGGKRKILLIIGGGVLDEAKHKALIADSYQKYKDYVIE